MLQPGALEVIMLALLLFEEVSVLSSAAVGAGADALAASLPPLPALTTAITIASVAVASVNLSLISYI